MRFIDLQCSVLQYVSLCSSPSAALTAHSVYVHVVLSLPWHGKQLDEVESPSLICVMKEQHKRLVTQYFTSTIGYYQAAICDCICIPE
jgi:hypothetical protein